jgi:hypothetical protein
MEGIDTTTIRMVTRLAQVPTVVLLDGIECPVERIIINGEKIMLVVNTKGLED